MATAPKAKVAQTLNSFARLATALKGFQAAYTEMTDTMAGNVEALTGQMTGTTAFLKSEGEPESPELN